MSMPDWVQSMQIYLARHGIPESGGAFTKDADRRLTSAGKAELRRFFAAARTWGVAPSLVLASPYVRAVETAEIAAKVLRYEGTILTSDAFVPMAPVNIAWDEIRLHSSEDAILIASHEPLVGLLSGYLTGAPTLAIEVPRGAMACIAMESFGAQPRGVLRWFVNPGLA